MNRKKNKIFLDKGYKKRLLISFAAGIAIGCLALVIIRLNSHRGYYTGLGHRHKLEAVQRPPIAEGRRGVSRIRTAKITAAQPQAKIQPGPQLRETAAGPNPVAVMAPGAHFKIAIVLDDFGYNYKNVEAVIGLNRPVTFSILPNLPYSKVIAQRAHEKKYESILHLPLEAHKEERVPSVEINTIMVSMKKEEVLELLNKAIESTPFILGVSNHQGSRGTEDTILMKIIFRELKKRGLFFLDSMSSGKSICKQAAADEALRFARRDVFLDNKEDYLYIKSQVLLLIKKAKKNGYAIGIGHDREKTVAALVKLLPEMEKEGAELVPLSELIK